VPSCEEYGAGIVNELRAFGLKGHVHTFRHAFISHALVGGVPEASVREWVGHVDAEILRHYTHIASASSQAAMQRLAEGRDDLQPEGRRADAENDEGASAQNQHPEPIRGLDMKGKAKGGCGLRNPLHSNAEREGFEPSVRFNPHTAFPVLHHRPLGHLSGNAPGILRIGRRAVNRVAGSGFA